MTRWAAFAIWAVLMCGASVFFLVEAVRAHSLFVAGVAVALVVWPLARDWAKTLRR